MEKCIITGKYLADDAVAITSEGPVALFLWGRRQVRLDTHGFALLPVDLVVKFRKATGKNPPSDILEDGGKCLSIESSV